MFYGAAEFSRDVDLLVFCDVKNLDRLDAALLELRAECIAVPPFEAQFLEKGHAVHFRCHHADAADMRVDVMSNLRGIEAFPVLWDRRTTIEDTAGTTYDLLSLRDLVGAKKTQRTKDWPMLQRLVEAHYFRNRGDSTPEQQQFWLLELRTPELIIEGVRSWPELAQQLSKQRTLLGLAQTGSVAAVDSALREEEGLERERDRQYWQPLKAELEHLRRSRPKGRNK